MATDSQDGRNSENFQTGIDPDSSTMTEEVIDLAQSSSDSGQEIEPVPVDENRFGTETEQAFPEVVTPDLENVVRLPANTSLDNVEIVGDDIVLTQADGTTITIKGAALDVPTFMLGDIELPNETLIAAFSQSGIDIAAGPNGNLVAGAGGADSSGNNFAQPVPGIGDPAPFVDLLPFTELQFPAFTTPDLLPELVVEDEPNSPIGVVATSLVSPDEAASEIGLDETPTQSPGSEEVADGVSANNSSNAETSSIGTISIDAPDGLAEVLINGVPVTGPGQMIDGSFGFITIVSFNPITGEIEYQYTATQSVSHNAADDPVLDTFTVEVSDINGDMASTTFDVGILDDNPSIGLVDVDQPMLMVDETDLATDTDSGDFSGLFSG
ncbi:MAG: hypothetical protein ACR2O3_05490, partial [Rhizobiaceae bacterium]